MLYLFWGGGGFVFRPIRDIYIGTRMCWIAEIFSLVYLRWGGVEVDCCHYHGHTGHFVV